MGRKRKKGNEDLPPNLTQNGDYFTYRWPPTGERFSMGSDRSFAIQEARSANKLLSGESKLTDKIFASKSKSWNGLIKDYVLDYQPRLKLKASTIKEESYRLNRIALDMGEITLDKTDQQLISAYLDSFEGDAYTKFRALLSKLFKFGIAKGLFKSSVNLALSTLPQVAAVKVRHTPTLDEFEAIRARCDDWLQVAMDFTLISLQRRGDCVNAKHSDIEDGYLKLIQSKTEAHGFNAYLKIKIGAQLQGVIKQAKKLNPFCDYIIAKDGKKVSADYLTKAFKKARDSTGIFDRMDVLQRPTFAEIRVLGSGIYKEKFGDAYTNKLMGHTTQKMTNAYIEQVINWTECEAGL
jgi:integrase